MKIAILVGKDSRGYRAVAVAATLTDKILVDINPDCLSVVTAMGRVFVFQFGELFDGELDLVDAAIKLDIPVLQYR